MTKSIVSHLAAFSMILNLGIYSAVAASDTGTHNTVNQHNQIDHSKMDHSKMYHDPVDADNTNLVLPTEPGQGAFATIAEIVVLLKADPNTDWNKVDIGQLRDHLIDMDEVTLRAKVTTKHHKDKIEFNISGIGRTKQAIQAMVPAHSAVLSKTTPWEVKAKLIDSGAIMTVHSSDPSVLGIIKALGFFGVMATGAHHQAHHLAMARGDDHVHAHQ